MDIKKEEFRISEIVETKKKETKEKKIPVKSDFQYIFENSCRHLSGHAPSEWRI